MDEQLKDNIREKWKEAGYDFDLAVLAFNLEMKNELDKRRKV